MGIYFITVFIFLLLMTFGAAVVLSLAWVAHVRYPLNRVEGALLHAGNKRSLLYMVNFYPVLSFLCYLLPLSPQGYLYVTIAQVLLCIPVIECSYQFYKLNKWNLVWLVLNTLAGGLYVGLLLVYGID